MKRLICLCLLLPFFAVAKNSFLVAPGIVQFDLSKPKTQSFIITNNGDENIRLSIEPIYLPIDDHTLNMGKHLASDTAALENITRSVRVSPKRLSLAPGQRRDIRISIRPDGTLPEGDYRTHLLVKMLEVSDVIRNRVEGKDSTVGMNLNVKMETAVAIYGTKGAPAPQLEFFCHQSTADGAIAIKVVNPTPWRFDGPIQLSQNNQTILDRRLVSLRGSEKERVLKGSAYDAGADYQVSYSTYNSPQQVFNTRCRRI